MGVARRFEGLYGKRALHRRRLLDRRRARRLYLGRGHQGPGIFYATNYKSDLKRLMFNFFLAQNTPPWSSSIPKTYRAAAPLDPHLDLHEWRFDLAQVPRDRRRFGPRRRQLRAAAISPRLPFPSPLQRCGASTRRT